MPNTRFTATNGRSKLNNIHAKDAISNAPLRVLHVLGSLERGGAETWTVELLEKMDRQRIQSDVLVHRKNGVYEDRVRATGAKILFCPKSQNFISYSYFLENLLKEQGPYDIVHSHLQLYSGLILRAAFRVGVTGRIAHARNSADGQRLNPLRHTYRMLMRYWIKKYAVQLLAVSERAAEGAFGNGVVTNGQCRTLTGIDFSPFHYSPVQRRQMRKNLNITDDTLVIGHVGSFRTQKNHVFFLDIAFELLKLRPDAVFIFIGDGALRPEIEKITTSSGKKNNFHFLRERNDVAYWLNGMDLFLFPSLYEGLPRVLLEAQAAGLPCIASSAVTPESAATSDSVRFLSLNQDPKIWAEVVIELSNTNNSTTQRTEKGMDAIFQFEAYGLTIASNAKYLTNLYEKLTSNTHASNTQPHSFA